MPSPVSSLPSLGPAADKAYARAGIYSAEEIRALGADEAYRRLIAAGEPPHFIWFYVLVMSLQGRPWNDCKGDEKIALRARFDAIKAEVKRSGAGQKLAFEAALDALGVIPKR